MQDFQKVFEWLWQYQLKMNPLKCAFRVTSREFLRFIVWHCGIEIDQSKIEAIQKILEPWNVHKLKSLQGCLAYICRFISNLARRCQPFNQLMKKGVPFEWDKACKNDFKSIKQYLTKPLMLRVFVPSQPFILYVATQEQSYGSLLTQKHNEKKEKALYYLS